MGSGGFKPNVAPLIAEKTTGEKLKVETRKDGKKVIVDPAQTSARIYDWFFFINVGALIGQISMSYAALYLGYYLAFLLPTALYLLAPLVLMVFKKHHRLKLPQGSVLGPAVKLLFRATKGRWSMNPVRTVKNMQAPDFWESVTPSTIDPARRPNR